MLAPQIEAHAEDPLFELGLAGRERYKEIAGPLKESTGIDIGFWQEGIARVAMDEAEVSDLRLRVAWQRQRGHLCDWFDADEVKVRWPWIGPTHGGLWAPHEAALEPETAGGGPARRRGAGRGRRPGGPRRSVQRRGDRVTGVIGRERYTGRPRGDRRGVVVAAHRGHAPAASGGPDPGPDGGAALARGDRTGDRLRQGQLHRGAGARRRSRAARWSMPASTLR